MKPGGKKAKGFKILGVFLLQALAGICLSGGSLHGQGVHEMTRNDKTEVFLQHIGKVARVDLAVYQALLLEYELARSLEDIGSPHPDPLLGDFIQRSLKKLHPDFDAAVKKYEGDKLKEAADLFLQLDRKGGPYLSAHSQLYLAEIDRVEGRHEESIRRASQLIETARKFLLPDYRACELIAQGYRALEKPLLEYLQLAILMTDYRELPQEVVTRVQSRLAQLEGEAGPPVTRIADWMDSVEKWIGKLKTSMDPTQTKQGEILVALDKVIELQEARERNTCPNCGSVG